MTTYTSLLKKTGKTVSYHAGDDGDLEKGVASSYTILNTGQYSGTVDVTMGGNTVAISNNCIQDNVTGLMMTVDISPVGIGSDPYEKGPAGTMTWSDDVDGNGAFLYAGAVNKAVLGGHADWRVPNIEEIIAFWSYGAHFPQGDLPSGIWTSTPVDISGAFYFYYGLIPQDLMTAIHYVLLVRGDPTAPAGGGGGSLIGGMVD